MTGFEFFALIVTMLACTFVVLATMRGYQAQMEEITRFHTEQVMEELSRLGRIYMIGADDRMTRNEDITNILTILEEAQRASKQDGPTVTIARQKQD